MPATPILPKPILCLKNTIRPGGLEGFKLLVTRTRSFDTFINALALRLVMAVCGLHFRSNLHKTLTKEGFVFFHRILFLVTKLRLHPFTLRNDLL